MQMAPQRSAICRSSNNHDAGRGMNFMALISTNCRRMRWWRLLAASVLTLGLTPAMAANLKVGEIRIMAPGDVDRVAVGNASVISTSLLKNGQLLVFGEAPGVTGAN